MLLQKLKGPPYSPLDVSIFPQSESRMKNSRSGVDSGIGESVLVSSGTRTVNSERLQTPSKTFSPAFLSLVQLCLQQDPEKRYYGTLLKSIKHMRWYFIDALWASLPTEFKSFISFLIKNLSSTPDNINAKNKQRRQMGRTLDSRPEDLGSSLSFIISWPRHFVKIGYSVWALC